MAFTNGNRVRFNFTPAGSALTGFGGVAPQEQPLFGIVRDDDANSAFLILWENGRTQDVTGVDVAVATLITDASAADVNAWLGRIVQPVNSAQQQATPPGSQPNPGQRRRGVVERVYIRDGNNGATGPANVPKETVALVRTEAGAYYEAPLSTLTIAAGA